MISDTPPSARMSNMMHGRGGTQNGHTQRIYKNIKSSDRIPLRWSWEGLSNPAQVEMRRERELLVKNSDDLNLSFLFVAISMDVHQHATTHSNVNESDLRLIYWFSHHKWPASLSSHHHRTLRHVHVASLDDPREADQRREKCFVVLKALMTHNNKSRREKRNLLVSYMLIFDNYDFSAGEALSLARLSINHKPKIVLCLTRLKRGETRFWMGKSDFATRESEDWTNRAINLNLFWKIVYTLDKVKYERISNFPEGEDDVEINLYRNKF